MKLKYFARYFFCFFKSSASYRTFLITVCSVFFCTATATAAMNVETYFQHIQNDPQKLYAFLKQMPKGGELHYHLAGGAYPETMLRYASNALYCLNLKTFQADKLNGHCSGALSNHISKNSELYHQVIRAWSLKEATKTGEPAFKHFFASFYKFMPIVADFRPQLLASIMKRAAAQHELYLEIQTLPDNAKASTFAHIASQHQTFGDKQKALMRDKAFKDNIEFTVKESRRIIEQARKQLHCEGKSPDPACSVTVKFQYYVLREQPINEVFAQALNGFAAVAQSDDLVGINLVQPENGTLALNDYKKQMQVFDYLHQVYPSVHIALHAGELTHKQTSLNHLTFHIHDAIFTGHAERIGHGVSIRHEDETHQLTEWMAKHPVAVEINLTSNHWLLDVAGSEHPLNYYLSQQVPVVLSTDDEGILRTNLTQEYQAAVHQHHIDYPALKAINRNALTYSFLPGNSLWQDPIHFIPIDDCQKLDDLRCEHYVQRHPKAKLQRDLELALQQFEATYAH